MTTLRQIVLSCPICRNSFQSQAVVSTNAFGGKRTDFHERAAGTQPLACLVHMCEKCGYSGVETDFTEEGEVSPLLKEHVLNELTPLMSFFITGSAKYEAAAKVAEWQGVEERSIADLKQSHEWFDRVLYEVDGGDGQDWIIAAAEQQRTDPQEWFGLADRSSQRVPKSRSPASPSPGRM